MREEGKGGPATSAQTPWFACAVAQEAEARETEKRAAVRAMNKGQDRLLRHSQRFDILTHKARVDDDPPPPPKPFSLTYTTRVGYNIVSNEPLEKHHPLAPEDRHLVMRGGGGGGGATRAGSIGRPRARAPSREFDVLTNRYKDGHDEKEAADRAAEKARAADRFWQTRDYHPLLGTYYDGEKDRVEAAKAEAADARFRARARSVEPRTMQLRETAAYEPIAHRVTDAAAKEAVDRVIFRVPKKPLKEGTEGRIRAVADEEAARDDGRALRRVMPDRWEGSTRRGYDVLTNTTLRGLGSLVERPVPTVSAVSEMDSTRVMRVLDSAATAPSFRGPAAPTGTEALLRTTARVPAPHGIRSTPWDRIKED